MSTDENGDFYGFSLGVPSDKSNHAAYCIELDIAKEYDALKAEEKYAAKQAVQKDRARRSIRRESILKKAKSEV